MAFSDWIMTATGEELPYDIRLLNANRKTTIN